MKKPINRLNWHRTIEHIPCSEDATYLCCCVSKKNILMYDICYFFNGEWTDCTGCVQRFLDYDYWAILED